MNKIVIALVALFASAMFAPAAQAFCDADDASEVADCVRSVMKVPGLRRGLPPATRPPAAIRSECDADDADDLKDCLRRLKAPGISRLPPPAAEAPVEKRLPDTTEAAPAAATIASSERPAKLGGSDETHLCQKYFPNVGKLVSVPCNE